VGQSVGAGDGAQQIFGVLRDFLFGHGVSLR
jgi:hypothetical protein